MKDKKLFTLKAILLFGIIAFVAINVIAYNQAYAMLNFAPNGERTKPIESLTVLEKIGLLFTGVTIPKPQDNATPTDRQLAYDVRYIESTDSLLEAWHIPAGKSQGTILLFHGYANSKEDLLAEASRFHRMGYNTLLVDFRGSGGSDGLQTTVGILEGDDVAATFRYAESLRTDQPIILYGRSMGAASILRALATTDIKPDAIIIEAVFAEMLTTVKNRFRSMGIPPFPAAQLLIFWAGIQQGFSGFDHNPAEYATQSTIPTLVMHGTDDPRATIDEGERVYAAIQSPAKQFVRFEKAGHESYLNAYPNLWANAVENFLQTVR